MTATLPPELCAFDRIAEECLRLGMKDGGDPVDFLRDLARERDEWKQKYRDEQEIVDCDRERADAEYEHLRAALARAEADRDDLIRRDRAASTLMQKLERDAAELRAIVEELARAPEVLSRKPHSFLAHLIERARAALAKAIDAPREE